MAKKNDWIALPEVTTALRDVLAHYEILGCTPGSSPLKELIYSVEGPPRLHARFLHAQEAFSLNPRHPEAIAAIARVTWASFSEPTSDMLRTINRLGAAEDWAVPVDGAFGQLWCRRITDAAWTVWTLACLHDQMMRHISLDEEWLEEFSR